MALQYKVQKLRVFGITQRAPHRRRHEVREAPSLRFGLLAPPLRRFLPARYLTLLRVNSL
jgi:hypothetical protein